MEAQTRQEDEPLSQGAATAATQGRKLVANVFTPEARAMDEKILSLWQDGNHSAVIDLHPDYRPFAPEG